MGKKALVKFLLTVSCFLVSISGLATGQPLTKDDVQLLLIGGASTEKMGALIVHH